MVGKVCFGLSWFTTLRVNVSSSFVDCIDSLSLSLSDDSLIYRAGSNQTDCLTFDHDEHGVGVVHTFCVSSHLSLS